MTYNILLVANNLYYKLLLICLKSILAVCNLEKINKIFIANLGLLPEYCLAIQSLSGKIQLIDTNTNIGNSKTIYSKDWINSVSQKTAVLRSLTESGHTPIIMIDSDTLVTGDFSEVINMDYDIQICKRTVPLIRKDGLFVGHIASFVAVNNINGVSFLNSWINRLEERIKLNLLPPHETPAMTETMEKSSLKIGDIDDKIVSCENRFFPGITKIIHAKGRSKRDKISVYRYANIKNLPFKVFLGYLCTKKEKLAFTLVFVYKKIFNFYGLKEVIKHAIPVCRNIHK